tara:strand:- start:720 stop:1211 length:492 start_codon:yes stop_codon:yes gene_type:complete
MIPTINANGEIRVTSGSSGGATEAKQDVMETTLDAILAKNTEIDTVLDTIKTDAMVETVIFNAQIGSSASGVSSAFERPRNAIGWAILIENTSDTNGNHEINLGRSVNNSIYFTSSTDYNTVGERNNVIEFVPVETLGSQKYFKITINNQDSSAHTYKVTVCA